MSLRRRRTRRTRQARHTRRTASAADIAFATSRPACEGLEPRRLLANVTVTNAEDVVDGDWRSIPQLLANPGPTGISFREALLAANGTPGPDVINFNIPGDGPHVITITSLLPRATDTVTIDGYSQPGAKANSKAVGNDAVIKVHLRGGADDGDNFGLHLDKDAKGSTVRGLSMTNFDGGPFTALLVRADDSLIEGNWIGLKPDGSVEANHTGVQVIADRVRVGGDSAGARNVVSGNRSLGIDLFEGEQNVVYGNYVGTSPDGLQRAANGRGMQSYGTLSTIGGTGVLKRNVISGNVGDGLVLSGEKHVVSGNYVGVGADGTTALGNGDDGIVTLGDKTLIGSTDDPYGGNHIAFNAGDGVFVHEGWKGGVTIRLNSIHDNFTDAEARTQLGINLRGGQEDAFGVTANDELDPDGGANARQNFPTLAGATTNLAATTVTGTLHSLPFEDFTLDFYASKTADPSGHGEGEVWLGSLVVRTDGNGVADFSAEVAASAMPYVSATATHRGTGNTSEFSNLVDNLRPFSFLNVDNTGSSPDVPGTYAYALKQAATIAGPKAITFSIPADGPVDVTFGGPLPTTLQDTLVDATTQGGGGIQPLVFAVGPIALHTLNGNSTLFGLGIVNTYRAVDLYLGGGNKVERCFIGVGPYGQELGITPLSQPAIVRSLAPGNVVRDSLIHSGRGTYAVAFFSDGNRFERNRVGVNLDGQAFSGNVHGLAIFEGSDNVVRDNTFVNASGAAIAVYSGQRNELWRNSITLSAGLGIDLQPGANGDLPSPLLTLAEAVAGGGLHLAGQYFGAANATLAFDAYATGDPADARNLDEGAIHVGRYTFSTDDSGYATIDQVLPWTYDVHRFFVGTVTDGSGNTSEFSAGVELTDQTPPAALAGEFDDAWGQVIRIRFDEPVTDLDADDVVVQRLPAGPSFVPSSVNWHALDLTATFRFDSLLPSGAYRVTLPPGSVQDHSGNVQDDPFSFDFDVVIGDSNNDGKVDAADYHDLDRGFALRLLGKFNGDLNGDGEVNVDDYAVADAAFMQQAGGLATPSGPTPPGTPPVPAPGGPAPFAAWPAIAEDDDDDDEPLLTLDERA